MKIIYRVIVTVPDEPQVLSKDYGEYAQDEDDSVGPIGMSQIVMAERLGYDEDYGFDYKVDYTLLLDAALSGD